MRTKTVMTIVLILLTIVAAGCIGKTPNKERTYTETVTKTITTTTTDYSEIDYIETIKTTETMTITNTRYLTTTITTTISGTETIITTRYLTNVTFTTITKIVTYYYGNDGRPNIVYYHPAPTLEIIAKVTETTVSYPTKYMNLYTPVFPIFRFYDRLYYEKLATTLSATTPPENAQEYIQFINNITTKIVIEPTIEYPTFLDAALSNGKMNEVEFAQLLAGIAIINNKTPTIVYLSNKETSLLGVIYDGHALIGTKYFIDTIAMNEYYYNLMKGHVNYYAEVNPYAPTLTISTEAITTARSLIGMMKTNVSYVITAEYTIHNTTHTIIRTGTFNYNWGSYTETNELGDTITAYVSDTLVYITKNSFTTNTTSSYPELISNMFLPAPLREWYICGKDKLLIQTNNYWLVLTTKNGTATGTFYNTKGEIIGEYYAIYSFE